jgi:hypothetical protein
VAKTEKTKEAGIKPEQMGWRETVPGMLVNLAAKVAFSSLQMKVVK